MTQRDLDRAVARATGECVETVSHRGFSPLAALPWEPDPEDLIVDWDAADENRRVSVYSPAPELSAAAC